VINNAGLIVQGPIELLAPADLRLQFDVNVIGPATVLGAFLPMLRPGRGRVVNISAANASATLHPVDTIVGPVLAALSARRPKPRYVAGRTPAR
jgi:NAD(P)-dependent dehydrogenase (short-subunit alcohol dehydrogenase family)